MSSANAQELADPFAQIFVDRAEAEWVFDFLRDTVKWLGIDRGAYDPRFALTLTERGDKPALHLSYGGWLVVGFRGPGSIYRVDLALLAEKVEWDERLVDCPFECKEGRPEVRTYHLPLELVKPLTSDLRQAYEATLAVIAAKFRHWKRPTPWKQHHPEIIEALFDPDRRAQLLAGLLLEPGLSYERHYTAFHHELVEEGEEYGVEVATPLVDSEYLDDLDKNLLQRSATVSLEPEKVSELIALVRQSYPNWSGFADPDFVKDEVDYKQATISKARGLLSETELRRLIDTREFDEIIDRLLQIGRDNNMLWRSVPTSGDLNILHDEKLEKPSFCEAMFDLLYGPGESATRLERYVDYVQARNLPNKWTFPTYFLFICHPESEMFVKPRTTKWFLEFFGEKHRYTTKPTASAYFSIKEITQTLENELAEYGPRDMVDIQGLIWVCRPEKQIDEEKLAEPFSQIFSDRDEAEWAFDFLKEALQLLGINDPNDPRIALTLPSKKILRLNFGGWAIQSYYGKNIAPYRVHLNFMTARIPEDIKLETLFLREQKRFLFTREG